MFNFFLLWNIPITYSSGLAHIWGQSIVPQHIESLVLLTCTNKQWELLCTVDKVYCAATLYSLAKKPCATNRCYKTVYLCNIMTYPCCLGYTIKDASDKNRVYSLLPSLLGLQFLLSD